MGGFFDDIPTIPKTKLEEPSKPLEAELLEKSPVRVLGTGFEKGALSVVRGIKQLTTGETEEDVARKEKYKELESDPGLRRYLATGEFVGSLFEPVTAALLLAGGTGIAAKLEAMGAKGALPKLVANLMKHKAVPKAIERGVVGGASGALFGGLSETTEGESRLGKAAEIGGLSMVVSPALGALGDVTADFIKKHGPKVAKEAESIALKSQSLADDLPYLPDRVKGPPIMTRPFPSYGDPLAEDFSRVISIESGGKHFNPQGEVLRSPKGAVGIAQVMPETAPEAARLAGLPFDRKSFLYDSAYNRALGFAYFRKQVEDFGGDIVKAAAAYNAGPGAVTKAIEEGGSNWLTRLPLETQRYVSKFLQTKPYSIPFKNAEIQWNGKSRYAVLARKDGEGMSRMGFEISDPDSFAYAAKMAALNPTDANDIWREFSKRRDSYGMFERQPEFISDESSPVSFPESVENTLGIRLPEKPAITDDFAGNINLARFELPSDVERGVKAIANDISNKRVSLEQLGQMASLENLTEENIVKELGDFRISPKLVAANLVFRKSILDFQELARIQLQNVENLSETDMAKFLAAFQKVRNIQKVVSNVTAEMGRSMRALQEPATLFQIDKQAELVADLQGAEGVKDLIRVVANTPDVDVLGKTIAQTSKPGMMDKFIYIYMNNLMSSGETIGRNILGNTFATAFHVPERALQVTLGKIPGFKPKPGEIPPTFRSMLPRINAFFDTVPEAFKAFGKGFLLDNPATKFTPGGSPLETLPEKILALGEYPMRFSSAFDGLFNIINMHTSLREQATDLAIKQGLKGSNLTRFVDAMIKDPPDEMLVKAADWAKTQGFHKEPGDILRPMLTIFRNVPALKLTITPFLRTLGNLTEWTLRRSPFNPLFKAEREAFKKGGLARNEMLSRFLLGSGLLAYFYDQAKEGKAIGPILGKYNETLEAYAQGRPPVSLQFEEGGPRYPLQGLEPISTFVSLGAGIAELEDKLPEETIGSIAGDALKIFNKAITDKTMLIGFSNLMAAIDEPDIYGEKWLKNLTFSFLPTVVKHLRYDDDRTLKEATTFVEFWKNYLPYAHKDLPPSYNMWGEVRERSNVGPVFLSPISAYQDTINKVKKEAAAVNFVPTYPRFKLDDEQMTARQKSFFIGYSGQLATKLIAKNMEMGIWKNLTQEQKQKIFKNTFDSARDTARAYLRREKAFKASLPKVEEKKFE